jgi:hypothetical protein
MSNAGTLLDATVVEVYADRTKQTCVFMSRHQNAHNFFLICIVGGGIKVHATLRPLNDLLCQPRVIMIMEKSVE